MVHALDKVSYRDNMEALLETVQPRLLRMPSKEFSQTNGNQIRTVDE